MALGCVCRLLWVYLFRWHEADTRAKTRVEQISKLLFPDSKRIFPQEVALDYFVNIVHAITMWNIDYGMNDVILPLVSIDASKQGLVTDGSMHADRIIIALRGTRAPCATRERRGPW